MSPDRQLVYPGTEQLPAAGSATVCLVPACPARCRPRRCLHRPDIAPRTRATPRAAHSRPSAGRAQGCLAPLRSSLSPDHHRQSGEPAGQLPSRSRGQLLLCSNSWRPDRPGGSERYRWLEADCVSQPAKEGAGRGDRSKGSGCCSEFGPGVCVELKVGCGDVELELLDAGGAGDDHDLGQA